MNARYWLITLSTAHCKMMRGYFVYEHLESEVTKKLRPNAIQLLELPQVESWSSLRGSQLMRLSLSLYLKCRTHVLVEHAFSRIKGACEEGVEVIASEMLNATRSTGKITVPRSCTSPA